LTDEIYTLLTDDHDDIDGLLSDGLALLGTGDAQPAFAKLDLFWARLAVHIRAEHQSIFPALIRAFELHWADGTIEDKLADVPGKIAILRHDHDFFMHEMANAIKAMREISPTNKARTCRSVAARLRVVAERLKRHNLIEEEKVYPYAARLLSSEDKKALIASIRKHLANMPRRFSDPRFTIDAFILAGGESKRMGRSKAGIVLGGSTLAEQAITKLEEFTSGRIYIVGSIEPDILARIQSLKTKVEIIADATVDSRSDRRASLIGVYTALLAAHTPWVCILSCDLPFVTPEFLSRLGSYSAGSEWDAVVPVQRDRRLQPLCAMYRRESCFAAVKAALDSDNWSLNGVLDRLNVRRVDHKSWADLAGAREMLLNINTPSDLGRAEEIVKKRAA
jgi:molybdopterin-guanine dinucleotide biosynthesis protein A/hemerythrin-like domain-containing protein